jgi:hypothetical protein
MRRELLREVRQRLELEGTLSDMPNDLQRHFRDMMERIVRDAQCHLFQRYRGEGQDPRPNHTNAGLNQPTPTQNIPEIQATSILDADTSSLFTQGGFWADGYIDPLVLQPPQRGPDQPEENLSFTSELLLAQYADTGSGVGH